MYKPTFPGIYTHMRDFIFAGSSKKNEVPLQKAIPINRSPGFVLFLG
jgi:hypothetical protein